MSKYKDTDEFPNMTLEELKAEAKRQGYNLIKIPVREKLLPCTCGYNRRSHWENINGEVSLYCEKCFKKATGKTEKEARRNWNEMIRKELENNEQNK